MYAQVFSGASVLELVALVLGLLGRLLLSCLLCLLSFRSPFLLSSLGLRRENEEYMCAV